MNNNINPTRQKMEYNKETMAKASGTSLPVSSKHAIEICRMIRNQKVEKAKAMLEDVLEMKKAVPFKRFNKNIGHRKGGIGPGRYPIKAAEQILFVLESAEANALFKGLDSSELTITKAVANKASRPMRYGRKRRGKSKRTHVELIVAEFKASAEKTKTKEAQKDKIEKNKIKEEKAQASKADKLKKEIKKDNNKKTLKNNNENTEAKEENKGGAK